MKYGAVILTSLLVINFNGLQFIGYSEAENISSSQGKLHHNVSYTYNTLKNRSAYIPSQCYTKTEDSQGKKHNPCYVCHTASKRPNFIDDPDLQLAYDFSEDPRTNPWSNLFKDRSEAIASISDETINQYINDSNYFNSKGKLLLSDTLKNKLPIEWDFNNNGKWDGVNPDLWYNFDKDGFDKDYDGNYSGWRTFAYYPFPGTFWPTNGSTDDVFIRLPVHYRQNTDGKYDPTVYKTNLAIVEAMIREQNIAIEPVSESEIGNIDLDKDGTIGIATKIVYDWAPLKDRFMWYAGKANQLQHDGQIKIAAGLYPKGTEFLHTVRYIDFDETGHITLAKRIKELRYARKRSWMTYSQIKDRVDAEYKEKRDFPDRLRTIMGNHEMGVNNGLGWTYAAFIEDVRGMLRPQTYEELAFCVGCHGGIGATSDGIFSFERKHGFDSYRHGWYHWSQKNIKGLNDPLRKDGKHEYTYYLEQNHAGDEFRANSEVLKKFFNPDGTPRKKMINSLKNDISQLLWPSKERAMTLNKAYKVIVEEQGFIYGRDAVVTPPKNVHIKVKESQETGVLSPVIAEKLQYQ